MNSSDTEHPDILEQLDQTEHFCVYRVQQAGRELRMTLLSRGLSESSAFRAAFRKDESTLASLSHDGILQLIAWGEKDGQLYYLTEFPEGTSLLQLLARGDCFSADELIDILWQMASGLQHAHNLAVAHGQLTSSSILIADPLRVKIAGFGLYRWIAATREQSHEPWRVLATRDLTAYGHIMTVLLDSLSAEQNAAAPQFVIESLRDLAQVLVQPDAATSARDVQGRLGDMLLAVAGESIDMVDNRKGQGLSRRSIVDELFEAPIALAEDPRYDRDNLRRGCLAACILLAGIALAAWLMARL